MRHRRHSVANLLRNDPQRLHARLAIVKNHWQIQLHRQSQLRPKSLFLRRPVRPTRLPVKPDLADADHPLMRGQFTQSLDFAV